MQHPLLYTAPHRLGPLVGDDLFRRLCRSRDYLASRLDQRLRLEGAAREAFLSPYHYHRLFSQTFGETPHHFLTRLRIDRAKQLLLHDNLPVTDICLAIGFESLGSFSSRFRQMVGYSPANYRRAVQKAYPVPRTPAHCLIPSCFLLQFGALTL